MSWHFVSCVLNTTGIAASEKLVLIALADRANHRHGGAAWPSVRDLAQRTGLCERSVQRALRRLEHNDLVVPASNTIGGRGKSTTYQLAIDAEKGDRLSPFTHPQKGDIQSAKGCQPVPKRVTSSTRKGDRLSPELEVTRNEQEGTTRAHAREAPDDKRMRTAKRNAPAATSLLKEDEKPTAANMGDHDMPNNRNVPPGGFESLRAILARTGNGIVNGQRPPTPAPVATTEPIPLNSADQRAKLEAAKREQARKLAEYERTQPTTTRKE